MKKSTLWAANNSSNSLKSSGALSMSLHPEEIYGLDALFRRRPAQPVLQILFDAGPVVQVSLCNNLFDHNTSTHNGSNQVK